MQTYLSTRPLGFASPAAGIEWQYVLNCLKTLVEPNQSISSVRSRTIRNISSARVSVPALLHKDMSSTDSSQLWVWRTNLAATQPFWENWFIGLSKSFLEAKGGKLLLLAGTDRLDKELIIGQMQGSSLILIN